MPDLLPLLGKTVTRLSSSFDQIPAARVQRLLQIANYIVDQKRENSSGDLIFICTHNSRRSQISQVWGSTAAAVFEQNDIICHSGGTEVTAFHTNAVSALTRAGFAITAPEHSNPNPVYSVKFASDAEPLSCYSKLYDDPANPQSDFAAVMTCSQADEACPYIPGALRVSLPFEDPKRADGSDNEATAYDETVDRIGRELLFAFSAISELA